MQFISKPRCKAELTFSFCFLINNFSWEFCWKFVVRTVVRFVASIDDIDILWAAWENGSKNGRRGRGERRGWEWQLPVWECECCCRSCGMWHNFGLVLHASACNWIIWFNSEVGVARAPAAAAVVGGWGQSKIQNGGHIWAAAAGAHRQLPLITIYWHPAKHP